MISLNFLIKFAETGISQKRLNKKSREKLPERGVGDSPMATPPHRDFPYSRLRDFFYLTHEKVIVVTPSSAKEKEKESKISVAFLNRWL